MSGGAEAARVEEYAGSHRDLLWSFREAEDSEELLDRYVDLGRVWVVRDHAGDVKGHLQVVPRDGSVWEVTNTAVSPDARGRGYGRLLLEHAVEEARRAGVRSVMLATGAADVGNLRFYQRCGFRMTRIVPDAFGPDTGYPDPIWIDGILLRDQVWFERTLAPDPRQQYPPG
jgi:GNAT superfamily N-acetyltransferase